LTREALDELPRDDLFDRARRALHLDPMIAFEQGGDFLTRRVQELGHLVNPDSCHSYLCSRRCLSQLVKAARVRV
jgi:hypothetical protein